MSASLPHPTAGRSVDDRAPGYFTHHLVPFRATSPTRFSRVFYYDYYYSKLPALRGGLPKSGNVIKRTGWVDDGYRTGPCAVLRTRGGSVIENATCFKSRRFLSPYQTQFVSFVFHRGQAGANFGNRFRLRVFFGISYGYICETLRVDLRKKKNDARTRVTKSFLFFCTRARCTVNGVVFFRFRYSILNRYVN